MDEFEIRCGEKRIKGRVYQADTPADTPAIILGHEFGLSMLSTGRYAKSLCKQGYTTWIFDFPGSGAGKSSGVPSTRMSIRTQTEDMSIVLNHVRTRHQGKIILGGASQGGMVAALLAAERESDVDGLFLLYPALCIPDDARRGCIIGKKIDPQNVPEKFTAMGYVRLGRRYVEDARMLDPWKEIRQFHKPVLILHGDADGIVPVSYARKAAAEYSRAELLVYPRAKHLFLRRRDFDRSVADIKAFLQRHWGKSALG